MGIRDPSLIMPVWLNALLETVSSAGHPILVCTKQPARMAPITNQIMHGTGYMPILPNQPQNAYSRFNIRNLQGRYMVLGRDDLLMAS